VEKENLTFTFTSGHTIPIKILRLIMKTYPRRGQKLGQTLQLQAQNTLSQGTTVTGQEKAIRYNNNMTNAYQG